jgi:hypothetical protein
MRGQPSDRDAELRMHFYGRVTVEITIDGNDSSRPMTVNVPQLGEPGGGEVRGGIPARR